MRALTRLGVNAGWFLRPLLLCASSMRAATPVATPAAMLVPLSESNGCPFRERPWLRVRVRYRFEASVVSDASRCPGAMTSGLAKPSYHDGPRELYGATMSSSRVTVFFVIAAP